MDRNHRKEKSRPEICNGVICGVKFAVDDNHQIRFWRGQ